MSEETTTEVATETKKRNKYPVTPEQFVETWNKMAVKGATAQEVADALKMPKAIVLARKANYVKERSDGTPGVELLPLKRVNPRKLDVERLNKIAAEVSTAINEAEAKLEAEKAAEAEAKTEE